nr:immunoglobulin light chain junction region [Macaca mulatta]
DYYCCSYTTRGTFVV